MSVPLIFTWANPAPEDCPTNLTETVEFLRQYLSGELNANIVPYIRQATTPGVDQQELVWERIDVDGRPLGTYQFYGGAWRKNYTGKIGEIVMYSGDPATDFSETGGKGAIGGDWDGWQLCNGLNGSPNLSDKFIVGAKMDDLGVGYSGNEWKTNVSGSAEQTGGVNEITLDAANTYRDSSAGLVVGLHTATGNAPNAGGPLYGSNLTYPLQVVPANTGNTAPTAIPTLPPYFAYALVIFKGYA